ncbi:MAG TPA: NAD(+)/NADH kinase [Actinomycetota bacterium]
MTRVGLVVHEGRGPAVAAASGLRQGLSEDGVAIVTLADEIPAEGLDLVVSVGGDGTFLRAARAAGEADCPVLGVKVGRLGFLTEVEPEAALDLIRRALAGDVAIERRMAVTAEPVAGAAFASQWALNEIMVEKRARHRLVRLALTVDGDYVTTLSADGVVVATPTGSTAYSFSARGPIVSPDVPCLVVTPVAVHMVFDRSFVLNDRQVVEVEVVGDEPGLLSADGRESVELPVGGRVRIAAAERPARLVRRDDAAPFLTRVREKFDLPDARGDVGVGD